MSLTQVITDQAVIWSLGFAVLCLLIMLLHLFSDS